MIDNTIYMVVNAPKEHQRIIGKLMTRLGWLYYEQHKIPFEPFSETMIDEGKTSPTPDLLLFDHSNKKNVIIIEISTSAGMKKDGEKVKELLRDYEIQEGFVYNYDIKKWRKFKPESGEITDQPSWCEALDLDLDALLK